MIDVTQIAPGDVVLFENRGQQFGGVVWRSPTTGDLIAGDTFLTLNGRWLPNTRITEIRPKQKA